MPVPAPRIPYPEHIVNLTKDRTTLDQENGNVFDLPDKGREELIALLTFENIPSLEEIGERTSRITILAGFARESRFKGIPYHERPSFGAMVDGAGPLVRPLRSLLRLSQIRPLESFTKTRIVEIPDGRGGFTETSVLRHVGWWPEDDIF